MRAATLLLFLFLLAAPSAAAAVAANTTTSPAPHPSAYRPPSKRGLSWANAHWVPIKPWNRRGTAMSGIYNWAPLPSVDFSAPFVPMLWGCDAAHIAAWDDAAGKNFSHAQLTPDRALLAFNEPELAVQANCTPKDAAAAWIAHFEPLKAKGFRLGTPAVTMGPEGKAWLLQFFAECAGGCNPDFLAVHWYDMTFDSLVAVLEGYYAAFNLPIWLTEYALTYFGPGNAPPPATQDQIDTFLRDSMAWLDAQPWVERYFWFGAMYEMQGVNPLNSLFDSAGNDTRSGALSPLGKAYLAGSAEFNATLDASQLSAANRRYTAPLFPFAFPSIAWLCWYL